MALAERLYLAAVEVPSGIPTGAGTDGAAIPGVTEALTRIATQYGLLGSLLALALVAIWYLDKKASTAGKAHDEEREDWQRQLTALHNARLADQREIVTALQNATGVISVNSQRMAETAASSQEVAKKLGEVALITHSNADALKTLTDAITWLTRSKQGGGGGA
jgi:methyl-accepting chemotaxis protein